jgi:drug/metabolite transporter (DMT)-like permease
VHAQVKTDVAMIETTAPESPVQAPSAGVMTTAGGIQRGLLQQWWIAFAASAVFVVGGHLLIKTGLNGLAPAAANSDFLTRALHVALNPTIVAGLLTYGIGTVCWMRAVSQKEISFLYPLSSINFVLILAASTLFLHETISLPRVMGVALVVTGMILMNTGSEKERG